MLLRPLVVRPVMVRLDAEDSVIMPEVMMWLG